MCAELEICTSFNKSLLISIYDPMLYGGDRSQDRHEESRPKVKRVEGKDIERDVSDSLLGKSSYQTDGSAIRDCKLQEKSYRLV